jgi:hypothetical protein
VRSWTAAEIYRPLRRNIVFYDGPSGLTGDRILGIATARNGNRKIGRMLQLWILPAISPIEAIRTGRDNAVCGNCPLRGQLGAKRACYVEYWRSPENIWQSQLRPDRTDRLSIEAFANRVTGLQLRIGAYGDPVAIPLDVWRPLLAVAGGWTAYTHQWRRHDLTAGFREWCMASVDTEAEQLEASRNGWRTFRVRPVGGLIRLNEVVCPHEKDERIKCADCSLCRGAGRVAKNVVVTVHGRGGRKYFARAPVAPIPLKVLRSRTSS